MRTGNAYRNSMEKKLKLNQKRMDAGLISEKFPKVDNIVIQMTYYQKTNGASSVLMERTVNYFSTSYAFFQMQCMCKECTNGGYELGPAIAGMVKRKKTSGKGDLVCTGRGEGLPKGHASVTYEIAIQYA